MGPKIYTAEMIPSFSNETVAGAKQWWNEMLELGLYIHPESDAADFVDTDTGLQLLDDNASEKVNLIYEAMYSVIGEDKTCDLGTTAWWMYQGYVWNKNKQEWQREELS